jgi:hypothetical protein
MKEKKKKSFLKIQIIPDKEKKPKEKKAKPAKPKKQKKAKKIEEERPKEKKKYEIGEIFGLIKDIGTALAKRFKRHFKVRIYRLHLNLVSGEAEKTALLYGRTIQSAYYLNEFLENNFKIRKNKRSVKIIPDFSQNRSSYRIDIKFYMRLSHMTALGIASLIKFFFFFKKQGKNTATTNNIL